MSKERINRPSANSLGKHLKNLREKRNETLAEVSGAVEIETESLINIEQGNKLPDEDILLLLISHFNLKKEEAINLWQLAGYDKPSDKINLSKEQAHTPSIVIMPFENRVLYTDLVNISINNYGLVMNFLQTGSSKHNPPVSVAKVGMSREHAKSVLSVLKKVLLAEQRMLDQSTSQIPKSKKKKDQD